jgi:mannosyltransferase
MDALSSLAAPVDRPRIGWRLTPLPLAAAMIVFAVALRLIGFGNRPLWLDEAYSAWFTSRSWHELWTQVPTYETHPPFYYSLLKLWRMAFGGGAVALRASSVVLTAATIPLVIAAAAEMERQRPSGRPLLRAGVAALLFACSPMLVYLGQEARPYPLLILSYALAVLGLLRLMREFVGRGAGDWPSWLMLVAGTELGLWAHALGLLYALSIAAALAPAWFRRIDRQRLARGIVAGVAIVLLYSPCLLMIINRTGDWGTGWVGWQPEMASQLLSLYAVPVDVLTVGSAIAALVMILLIKRSVEDGIRPSGWNADRALLLLWWGPPLLAILISQFAIPIFLIRTLSATLVPAYLALAGAIARAESPRERFAFTAALAITLTPSAVQAAMRPATEQWDEVAAYLKVHVQPGDRIWVYPNDSALPLREAGARQPMHGVPGDYPAVGFKGPIRAGSPAVLSVTKGQATTIANDPALRGVPTVWLVTRQSRIFDPANDMPTALSQVRQPGRLQKWGYIDVRPYYRR